MLGLYQAEQEGNELFEYAEDWPSELARQAVEMWRRYRRRFPSDFVEALTPEWDWLLK